LVASLERLIIQSSEGELAFHPTSDELLRWLLLPFVVAASGFASMSGELLDPEPPTRLPPRRLWAGLRGVSADFSLLSQDSRDTVI